MSQRRPHFHLRWILFLLCVFHKSLITCLCIFGTIFSAPQLIDRSLCFAICCCFACILEYKASLTFHGMPLWPSTTRCSLQKVTIMWIMKCHVSQGHKSNETLVMTCPHCALWHIWHGEVVCSLMCHNDSRQCHNYATPGSIEPFKTVIESCQTYNSFAFFLVNIMTEIFSSNFLLLLLLLP